MPDRGRLNRCDRLRARNRLRATLRGSFMNAYLCTPPLQEATPSVQKVLVIRQWGGPGVLCSTYFSCSRPDDWFERAAWQESRVSDAQAETGEDWLNHMFLNMCNGSHVHSRWRKQDEDIVSKAIMILMKTDD